MVSKWDREGGDDNSWHSRKYARGERGSQTRDKINHKKQQVYIFGEDSKTLLSGVVCVYNLNMSFHLFFLLWPIVRNKSHYDSVPTHGFTKQRSCLLYGMHTDIFCTLFLLHYFSTLAYLSLFNYFLFYFTLRKKEGMVAMYQIHFMIH